MSTFRKFYGRHHVFVKKSLKIPKGGNQNPYIEEEQTTHWPKEKVQRDKQRSTKYIHKTKDRVTRTPLKTGDELRFSGRVSSSCSIKCVTDDHVYVPFVVVAIMSSFLFCVLLTILCLFTLGHYDCLSFLICGFR